MKRGAFHDPKSGMRYVLVGQVERVAMAQDSAELARALNMLGALADHYTEGDGKFEERAKRIEAKLAAFRAERGLDAADLMIWPDELRYEWLGAIVACLARKGMLDSIPTPGDTSGWVDEEGEVVEAPA